MPLFVISELRIRPDRVGEFEEIVERAAEQARGKPDSVKWATFEVTSGEFGTYQVLIQAESWVGVGAVTSLEPASELWGKDQGPRVMAQMRSCLASARQMVIQDRVDLSSVDAFDVRSWRLPLVEITTLRARPGHQAELEEYVRRLADAARKTSSPRRFLATETILGELFEYTLATPFATLAELDELIPPAELLIRAFGQQEGARIREASLKAIERADRHILVRRGDLSNP